MKRRGLFCILYLLLFSFLLVGCTKKNESIGSGKEGHYVKIVAPSKEMPISEKINIEISYGHSIPDYSIDDSTKVKSLLLIVESYAEEGGTNEELEYTEEVSDDFYTNEKYKVIPGKWVWSRSKTKFNCTQNVMIDFSKYEEKTHSLYLILTTEEYEKENKYCNNVNLVSTFLKFTIKDGYIYF